MAKNKDNTYTGYIYVIKNSINNKVYVGQTRATIAKRWSQHKSDANRKTGHNIILYNAMNKYGIDNFTIEQIFEITCKDKKDLICKLNEYEIHYISLYNSLSPNGYNLTIGGNNNAEHRKKPVVAYFYNGEIDIEFDSATEAALYFNAPPTGILKCCDGLSQLCKGRIWRYKDDAFDKYEIKITERQLNNSYLVLVDKYTLDGTYLSTYNTIKDAIDDDINVKSHNNISQCCMGNVNQAYGYVWRYSGEPFGKFKWKENECYTPVDAYSLDGEFISSFESIASGAREFNINHHSHILSCCQGKRLSCGNIVWRFKGEPFDSLRTERRYTVGRVYNHYDLNNNFIESIVGIKNLSNSPHSIHDCCNGLITHIGDSKWFYGDDINNPDKTKIVGEPKEYNTSQNVEPIFNKFIEPICIYDRYGNFIKEYENARVFSKEKNIHTQSIYDVCDGKFAYHENFVYRYKKDPFDLYYDFSYTSKHVNIYDKENNFITQAFGVKECVRILNIDTKNGSSIKKCLSHNRKYAYGYQFFYASDPTQPDKTKIIENKKVS